MLEKFLILKLQSGSFNDFCRTNKKLGIKGKLLKVIIFDKWMPNFAEIYFWQHVAMVLFF